MWPLLLLQSLEPLALRCTPSGSSAVPYGLSERALATNRSRLSPKPPLSLPHDEQGIEEVFDASNTILRPHPLPTHTQLDSRLESGPLRAERESLLFTAFTDVGGSTSSDTALLPPSHTIGKEKEPKRTKNPDAVLKANQTNSARNLCIQDYLAARPGQKPTTREFDEYWEGLTAVQKEPFSKRSKAANAEKKAGKVGPVFLCQLSLTRHRQRDISGGSAHNTVHQPLSAGDWWDEGTGGEDWVERGSYAGSDGRGPKR
ncbi:hypothetical protein R3P38DRAFT_2800040 [Favolaschia claudopus]|uniref:Uncharacterized protein n=1 Tax=Favolaschia claudopus TaxID=2862362 RepID=A0AAV9ZYM6_9AGAR